jgi:hypothetical protein
MNNKDENLNAVREVCNKIIDTLEEYRAYTRDINIDMEKTREQEELLIIEKEYSNGNITEERLDRILEMKTDSLKGLENLVKIGKAKKYA